MDSIDTTIRFENVSFAYPSRPGVPVLKHFSCSFPAKKFSCIIGNSGGGKSTTMSLILRMYEPSSGTLWLGNHEFNTVNLTFLRECFAYVTQQPVMFSQTIRENLLCEPPFALCLFVTSCADTLTPRPPPNNSPLPSRMRVALASSILSPTAWKLSSLVCPRCIAAAASLNDLTSLSLTALRFQRCGIRAEHWAEAGESIAFSTENQY